MGTFLEEMMGFSNNLVRGKEPVPLFDPESISVNLLEPESDDSEGDGTSLFKTQALQGSPGYRIPRTRSQTKADQSNTEPARKLSLKQGDAVNIIMDTVWKTELDQGDLVFAHKGKAVPCWFPGLVTGKTKKGLFSVAFLADFGQENCPRGNIMPFGEYETKKEEGKDRKLFEVPKKLEPNFQKALTLANQQSSANL